MLQQPSVDPFNIALETHQAAELNPQKARALFNAYLSQPQQWKSTSKYRYSHVLNNPLKLVNPDGMEDLDPQQVVGIAKR
jgi:hypothetical protein